MAEVKLLATWFSSYSYRVIWALKMKGIQYKYIEDDLFNKSTLLLQHNPVHRKVPVLIHGGKPIVESMVILEYIEETWPHCPLLSKDPFERTLARFWSKFADDMGPVCWRLYQCSGNGEERETAVKECLEMMEVIEDYGIGEKKFFGGDAVNIVDLAFGGLAYWLGVIEEIMGIKLLESHKFPRLNAWIENFKEVPVIKANHPDRERMLEFYKTMRERLIATP